MTLTLPNGGGSFEISEVLVKATTGFAERMAELTVSALKALGYPPEKARFPRWFLLELAAVQQMQVWEKAGITQHLGIPLPTFEEAMSQLIQRCLTPHCAQNKAGETPFSREALRAWTNCVSWEAPEMIGAQIAVTPEDDDSLVEALAQFLFENRHAIAKVLDDR